jgi:probable HAF family extracellular repeat protein
MIARPNRTAPLRRTFLSLLGALLLSGAAATASLAQEYDFVYVDAFQSDYDLRECLLYDVNDQGQACGWATDLPSYSAFSWTSSGGKTRLPFTLARGINAAGKVAGLNRVYDTQTGELATIGQVPGAPAPPFALAINDHDVVVGYAETCICSNSNRVLQIPFVWDPVNGSRAVAVPGAKELVSVNNLGVAVGNIRASSRDGFVYEIATGRTILLQAYLPPNQYPWTEAAGINDLGVATGRHRGDDFSTFHGFVWTEAGGATLLPHLLGNVSLRVQPWAINDANTVVGQAEVAQGTYHAFVWNAVRGIVDLNDVVDAPPGFILDRALSISDGGFIVGDGHFGPNWSTSQAFVLVPRPVVLGVDPVATGRDLRVVPNPAAGATRIEYVTPAAGTPRIEVFDVRGRRVASIVEPERAPGAYVASWDGRDANGGRVVPGAYVVRLSIADLTISRKLAVVR